MISVIIPVYNEADNIKILAKKIKDSLLNYKYEVIFINDGSIDETEKKIKEIVNRNKNFLCINFKRNFGQTAALQAGFDYASGKIIIALDGDLQNDPSDIPKLIKKINEGYDVVSGWRKNRKDSSLSRVLPSIIANYIISKITGVSLHDYGCTLKAYKKDVIKDIKLYGEMHRFIPIYACWEGAKVTEIEVNHSKRYYGKSKYGISRIPKVLLDLMVVKFFDKLISRPIHLFGKLGFSLITLGFFASIYAIWLKIFRDISFILTPLPLLIIFFLLSGILCILLGIVAEIQSRIYFQAGNNKSYLVKNIFKSNKNKF
ncbi:MAG: glycosyltransferase [Pelagibacterales bacterium]|nr:glycosyltransferase [Pelagibacterales bacterium]